LPLGKAEQNVDGDQRRDDQKGVDDREVVAEQSLLRGLADDQQQDEVEGRHLGEGAAAGKAKQDQQEQVDRTGAKDGIHAVVRDRRAG
jgi:hypothetical protein